MIKVTVLYPNTPDAKFDMKYYVTHHMPMVRDRCGPACRSIAAASGIAGEPGAKPAFIAIGELTFDSLEAFQKAFVPHGAEIRADIPNYTNTQPIIQINEITL